MHLISNVIKNIIIKEPFYGLLAINLDKRYSDKIPTAGVTFSEGRYVLTINKEFFTPLSPIHRYAVIKHELLHLAFKHLNTKIWDKCDRRLNIAMDLEVQSYIDESMWLGEGAAEQIFKEKGWEKKLGTKIYYEKLKELEDSEVEDLENPDHDFAPPQEIDDLISQGLDRKAAETVVQGLMQSILDDLINQIAEQAPGSVPAEIEEQITKKKGPAEVPWNIHLRRVIRTASSYQVKKGKRRESVRFEGFYKNTRKKKLHIMVAIDTSGSIDMKSLSIFEKEIQALQKQTEAVIELVQCDSKIHQHVIFQKKFEIGKIYGRGGTSFLPVIDLFKHSNATALIYFTDGYGDQDCISEKVKNYLKARTLWVLYDNTIKNLPGKNIYIKKN